MSTVTRAPRVEDPLVGKVVAEKYRVLQLVARGGMGRIYRAEQLPLGRIVALKTLTPRYSTEIDPQIQKRFLNEAATCAKLTHPNTVTVFDYGALVENGEETFFMVMEFCEGRTLARALREDGPFSPGRALKVGREICRSLREAHKLGIVHRDLKPSNVMLFDRDDGEGVKVLDFGIAKSLHDDNAESLTLEGNFLGSPRYMAPEQVRHADVDGRADIYALGIVLYELLSGVVPFDGDQQIKTLMAHLQEPVPWIRARSGIEVPPEVEAVVRKCLSKDPNERYADVDELKEALRVAAGVLTDETEEVSREGRTARSVAEPKVARPPPPRAGDVSLAPTVTGPRATPTDGGSRVAVLGIVAVLGLLVVVALVAVVAVFAFGTGDGLMSAGKGSGTTSSPTAPATADVTATATSSPTPPPAPTKAVLTVTSTPSGAQVWEGNRLHGVTPLPLDLDLAALKDAPRHFEVRMDGYEPYPFDQGPVDADVAVDARLVAVPPPAPAPAPKATPKATKPKPKATPKPKTSTDDILRER